MPAASTSSPLYLTAEFDEFVNTEAVVFNDAAPVCVDHSLAVFLRADTVFPVVFVSETAARPAKNGEFHFAESLYDVGSHSLYVRNGRIFANVNAVVDASAKMLGEVTVDIFIDTALLFVGVDNKLTHVF